MSNIHFLSLSLVAALTITAQARLLETTQECDARYGVGQDLPLTLGEEFKSEEDSKWTAKIYSARGLAIQIIFENNMAVLLRYSSEPALKVANSTTRSIHLTADEISYLRSVNLKEEVTWKPHKAPYLDTLAPSMTLWISSDKKSYAGYDRDNRQLFVCNDRIWEIVTGKLKNQAASSASNRFKGL